MRTRFETSSSGSARVEAILKEIADQLAEVNAKLDSIVEHLVGLVFIVDEDAARKGRPPGVPVARGRGKR